MVARKWLLASALPVVAVLACPSGGCDEARGNPYDEDSSRPRRLPPTRGQDLQRCAWFALPEVINLAPVSTSWFARDGKWTGKMGAELVNWEQNRFRIDYTNIDYYVDLKPWFHAKVLRNPDLELGKMNIWLPEIKKRTMRAATTVVYMDCESTPMYVSREFQRGDYEIFNYMGQLVATGAPSELVPGQLYFKDEKGIPFAIAGSPTIAEVATGQKELLPQWHLYDFDHWQIWYMEGFNSISYLKEPEHRWIVAAVVQEHAILGTLVKPDNGVFDGVTSTPLQYIAFVGLTIATCLGIVVLSMCSCVYIFLMVYPPKRSPKGNPFMVEDIGGHPYGSFAMTHQRP